MWATALRRSEFVNVVLHDGAGLASCRGEMFCLEPLTGVMTWHNPLKGFGRGLATIATEHWPGDAKPLASAEKRRRDEQDAAAGAVVAATG